MSLSKLQSDLALLRGELSGQLSRAEARKLSERLNTVASLVRLPLPADGTCNKTPMQPRWVSAPASYLKQTDPRSADEVECVRVELMLWAQLAEFSGAPPLSDQATESASRILGRAIDLGGAHCFLNGEPLTFSGLRQALKTSTTQVGSAELPIEYKLDLRKGGRHRADNLSWVSTALDRITLRNILARNSVPKVLLEKIQVKAYATDKVTIPPHYSNRDYRWATWVDSNQFATRSECQAVELELLAQVMEFQGAPKLNSEDRASIEEHRGRPLKLNGHRCPISGTLMKYEEFVSAATDRTAGRSAYHVGHFVPLTRGGSHSSGNVVWMTEQGNRIQGSDTFDEIVGLIRSAAKFHERGGDT